MAAGVHFDYRDNVNQVLLEKHSAKPSGAFSAASELPNFENQSVQAPVARIESLAGNKILDYSGREGDDGGESLLSNLMWGGGSLLSAFPTPFSFSKRACQKNTEIWGRRYLKVGHNPAGIVVSCQMLHF